MENTELRYYRGYFEVENRGKKPTRIVGSIPYNSESVDMGYTEFILPGAFARSIKSGATIKSYWNHDISKVLGSTASGTLKLTDGSNSLRIELVPPDNTWGRDALESVARGDTDGFSFGFTVESDYWQDNKRYLEDVNLYEVSPTPLPAYGASTAYARSAVKQQTERHDLKKFFRREEKMKKLEQQVDRFFAEGVEYKNYLDFFNALQRRIEYQEDDPKIDKRASGLSTLDMPELPGELVNKLLQPQNVSPMWTMATKIPIGGGFNSVQIPAWSETTRGGSVLDGVVFSWMEEAGSSDYVMPKFRQLNLNLWKCQGVIAHTSELREDGLAFEDVIQNALQSGLNSLIEEMIIRGTGSGQPLGILNADATIVQAKETCQSANSLYAENITAMISHLPPESMYRAVWIAHPETLKQLSQLNLGGPLFHYRQGGERFHKLCGLDLIFFEHCSQLGSAADLILADLSQMIVSYKPLEDRISIHVLFDTDEECYKLTMRWNCQPAWSKAITPAQGSTKITPFVILADRS